MDDLISRKQALNILHEYFDAMLDTDTICPKDIYNSFESLPSAQKTGKWIENDNGTWSCNRCHSWIPDEQHYYANFCLYCGADMRGDSDDN